MEFGGLIYLDNAATSYPKPPEVYSEVLRSLMQYGGNPGRGAHRLSLAASEKIYECRTIASELFGASDTERIFFTMNTTHGLNTVIKGLLKKGDHVLISNMEHNAVYRPIYKMASRGIISYDIFNVCSSSSEKICADIAHKLRRNTKAVICTHSSNICSLTVPIREITSFCKKCGLFVIIDGAQSAGHEVISVDDMHIDALCVPGHKGLYGPQGTGMVVLGKGVSLDTLTEGGNGVNSLMGSMPELSPERYEAGTLPTPSIAGLCEGMRFVRDIGVERISEHEKKLCRRAKELLLNTDGVKVYCPEYDGATLLFNIKGFSADRVGTELNNRDICVRSGYHCSALGHKSLGTEDGGAVRVSFGAFNNINDTELLYKAISEIIQAG